jgi:hypothetical protein
MHELGDMNLRTVHQVIPKALADVTGAGAVPQLQGLTVWFWPTGRHRDPSPASWYREPDREVA